MSYNMIKYTYTLAGLQKNEYYVVNTECPLKEFKKALKNGEVFYNDEKTGMQVNLMYSKIYKRRTLFGKSEKQVQRKISYYTQNNMVDIHAYKQDRFHIMKYTPTQIYQQTMGVVGMMPAPFAGLVTAAICQRAHQLQQQYPNEPVYLRTGPPRRRRGDCWHCTRADCEGGIFCSRRRREERNRL